MKKIQPLKNTWTTLAAYTLLFCILMAGIFALFIAEGRSFVNQADAYDQGYFWTVEMKHHLESLMSGGGYPVWSWDRGTGLDTKFPVDPFLIIAALFPAGQIELGYTVAILLRLYFAGIAFILFCKEVELSNFQALTGALCYIAATWTINLSLMQGQFIDFFIIFPLLVMSVDRIYKGKSPVMFMLMVGIAVGVNYYLAYMAAIGIIIYIFFRYFRYHKFSFGKYFAYIGRFMIYGIIGIMISAVFILVTLQTLSGASTGSRPAVEWLYDTSYYYGEALRLVSQGYAFSYTNIGIPIFALLALVAFKGRPSGKATHVIMSLIMLAMTMAPFFGSMFNGFGYVSNRWYFMLIFFLVWCAAEHMDLDKMASVRNIVFMMLWWFILAGATLGFSYFDITGDMSKGQAAFVAGNLAAGFVMILIVASHKVLKSLRARQTLIILSVVGTLVLVWNCSFYGKTDFYFKLGEIDEQLRTSTQRAGALIEDDGFYRIDQVDWINTHLKADQPVNENLWWQNNTIYLYDSKLPSRLSEFNKLTGNNLGYSKRVYVQSNGNRMGLDFLYGVKYFLGDDIKNGKDGADERAGYAFDYYDNLDGVNVFRSRYDSSLGFVYGKFITESEFLRLSRLEREQALLQAVVVPDEEAAELDETKEVKAKDIDTDVRDVPYEITSTDGLTIDGNTINAEVDDASFVIHVGDVTNSQLVVSFDDLRRVNDAGEDIGDFKIKCANEKLKFDVTNKKNNQTIPGIVDFDLNMGYYDSYSGYIRVRLSRAGRYEFGRLYVSAMSAENFDKYAAERCKSVFRVAERKHDKVSGTVNAAEDGWLFLSMPVNDNWNVFIDGGQVAEIHNANIAFFATPVTKGEHKVEVRYDYRSRHAALAITIAGLVLMVIAGIIDKIRNRQKKKADTEADAPAKVPADTEADDSGKEPEHGEVNTREGTGDTEA